MSAKNLSDFSRTVAPVGAPAARFNIQSNPQQFGGGIATEMARTGHILDKAADTEFNLAMAQQDIDNETHAKEAATKFDRSIIDLSFNPQTGYFAQKGSAAVEGQAGAEDAAEKMRNELLDGLPTDRSRRMAERVIDSRLTSFRQSAGAHAMQERKVWMNGASEARVQTLMDDAANWYNDDQRFNTAVGAMRSEALAQGEVNGLPAEKVAQLQRTYASNAWVARIGRMAIDTPVAAFDMFRKNIGQIEGTAQIALEKSLKEATYPVLSRDLATRVMGGQSTPDVPALTEAATKTPALEGTQLANAVIARESGGNQAAVSNKGAVGIMQLMPDTAREVAAKMGVPFDPEKLAKDADYNRQLGTAYLQQMLTLYGGNQTLALAAYNAGPGRVDAWLQQNGNPNMGQISDADWAAKIPFQETRDYVAAINNKVAPKPGAIPTSTDVREHLSDWVKTTREAAQAMRPNDPIFADQAVSHVMTYAGQVQHGAQFQEKAARDLLLTKALGLAKTSTGDFVQAPMQQRPTSLTQLLQTPEAKQAWSTAEPIQQSAVLSLLEHNARGTNPPVTNEALSKYYELKGLSVQDRTAFAAVNLADTKLLNLLPHELTRELMTLQTHAASNEVRDMERGQSLDHAKAIARPMLMAAKIAIPTKPGEKAATYDQFVGRLDEALNKFMGENKRRANDTEIRQIAGSLLTAGAEAGSGWLWGALPDSSVKAFQADPSKFYVPVPSAERPKIIADYKAAFGVEPTESKIRDIFTAQQLRQKK